MTQQELEFIGFEYAAGRASRIDGGNRSDGMSPYWLNGWDDVGLLIEDGVDLTVWKIGLAIPPIEFTEVLGKACCALSVE